MAIQFARLRILTRSKGHNVVRTSAYNARSRVHARRTGETFDFADRDGLLHHEVLLPDGAPGELYDPGRLWNAAQLAEKRVNSQEAKELLLALPGDSEITDDDRIRMTRDFVQEHFVDNGLAVQFDIHAPHEQIKEGERNYHAHVLVSTRRLGPEGFGAKARDLNGAFAKGFMVEGERWGELWRDAQNEYFMRHGIDLRVDDISLVPGEHIGPRRLRAETEGSADVLAMKRNRDRLTLARELMRDPERIIDHLTASRSTFTVFDLGRLIDSQGFDEATATGLFEAVIRSDEILYTMDDKGELSERFTTRTVRREEEEIMTLASALHHRRVASPAPAQRRSALVGKALSAGQLQALNEVLGTATDGRALTIIRGRAGTGKSRLVGALRSAYRRAGHEVIGLAPTHVVVRDVESQGFDRAFTVHSFLFRTGNGLLDLAPGTKLMIDEAAMLDNGIMRHLIRTAHGSGSHLILVGDDRQISAVERGGIFTDMAETFGAVELRDVRRQESDWARQATLHMARGNVRQALDAYDAKGFVMRAEDSEASMAALAGQWQRDHVANPQESQFVFAYRNKDVDQLNGKLRRELQALGEVSSKEVLFRTKHGRFAFAKGDRIQITETDKRLDLINGMRGRVLRVAAGSLVVRIDGETREIKPSEFTGFRHGYAGTLYKGQGRTVDRAYLFHTKHWGRASSYVALSRHRKSAHVFVSGEFRDMGRLARSMARDDRKLTSLAYEVTDPGAEGKLFEINDRALLDTYEQAQLDYRYLRRLDGAAREAAFKDMQLDAAAIEIAKREAARVEAEQRALYDGVTRRVSAIKSGMRNLSRGSRLVARGLRVALR